MQEPEPTINRPAGRIEDSGSPAGPPTPEMLESRARELAVIEGRSENEVTDDDRKRAALELHDQSFALTSDDTRPEMTASHNPADMAVDRGHEVTAVTTPDEQQIVEAEIKEGIREAEHDRMLRGRSQIEEEKL